MQDFNKYIFLIGAARSGTKIVRDTLANSKDVSAIPYDINYIWRNGNEGYEHDELNVSTLNARQRKYIRNKIIKYGRQANINGSVLIEKTVANPLRLPFVKEIFPEAKFIHIVRNGYDVTESSIRQWNSSPSTGYFIKKLKYFPLSNFRYLKWFAGNFISGLFKKQKGGKTWGPRYMGIYSDLGSKSLPEVCANQWKECVIKATNFLSTLSPNEYLTITYEEFVADTEVLKKICHFIEVDEEQCLEYYEKNVVSSNIGKAKMNNQFSDLVKSIISQANV